MTSPIADHVNGHDHDGGDHEDTDKAGERWRCEEVHPLLRADTRKAVGC